MFGRKLAFFNQYKVQQSVTLYQSSLGQYVPSGGTTKDVLYGELGVATLTLELGNGIESYSESWKMEGRPPRECWEEGDIQTRSMFFRDCESLEDKILPENQDRLLYTAKASQAPFEIVSVDMSYPASSLSFC